MRLIETIWLFLTLVYRPVTSDIGDTWIQAWIKYKLNPKTAWEIAKILKRL